MVLNASRLTHSAGRQDDLGRFIVVNCPGLLARNGEIHIREVDGVHAPLQKCQRLLIIIGPQRLPVVIDGRGLHRQWGVHPHREVAAVRNEISLLDFPDVIEHFLRSSDRKRRDDQIAALLERGLNDLCQSRSIVYALPMGPVPIGGFHYDVVGTGDILRVPDKGLIQIPNIAAEDDFLCNAILGDEDLNGRGAEQMAGVNKADLNAIVEGQHFLVTAAAEQPQRRHSVIHSIERIHRVPASPFCLPGFPLRLKLLNVRGVLQHDGTEVLGSPGTVNGAGKALCRQQRQLAGMVNVGVGQEDTVYVTRRHRDFPGGVDIRPLFESAVNQNLLAAGLEQITGAGDFVVRTDKCQSHE